MNAINPATKFQAVSKSDTAKIAPYVDDNNIRITRCRALYVGKAGNLIVKNEKGANVTWPNVPIGIHKISTDHIISTLTTADDFVAIY